MNDLEYDSKERRRAYNENLLVRNQSLANRKEAQKDALETMPLGTG